MAFSNQFSISLELSKIVPLAPVLNLASKGLLDVVRSLQNSGSDFVTEHDLAEIFGRSLIDPKFESTFKNAVRTSAIHKISGIAELVLEIGAGPTVSHAINNNYLFSMVVQLSSLIWAHHTNSLATALVRALESRESGESKSIPRIAAVLGTLRCISQQTSGFPWEYIFAAVDASLLDVLKIPQHRFSRAIPHVVLRTLIDALPVVQRFPETHVLNILTTHGVTTLIVWAHHLLGLTVEVQWAGKSHRFGNGPSVVLIDMGLEDHSVMAEVTLLNETQEATFHASVDPFNDQELEPASRHPMLGYGNNILSLKQDRSYAQLLVARIVQSCMLIMDAEWRVTGKWDVSGNFFTPPKQRIIEVAQILFPGYDVSLAALNVIPDKFCLAQADWYSEDVRAIVSVFNDPPMKYDKFAKYTQPLFRRLCRTVLAISMLRNPEDCKEVPLTTRLTDKFKWPYPQIVDDMAVEKAFEILAELLLGDLEDHSQDIKRAAVISHRGWSICISSIGASDPSRLESELVIIRGVPSRKGDRKEWIQDNSTGETWDSKADDGSDLYKVVAKSGDKICFRSFWPNSDVKFMIGTTPKSFLVFKDYSCSNPRQESSAYIRLGFRSMQNLYWGVCHVPPCEHVSQADDTFILPQEVCAFQGLLGSWSQSLQDFENEVHSRHAGHLGHTSEPKLASSEIISHAEGPGASANSSATGVPDPAQDHTSIGAPSAVQLTGRVVSVSVSAGNPSMRWILLANSKRWTVPGSNSGSLPLFSACYLRDPKCCVTCGIKFIQERDKQRRVERGGPFNHVLLIA